MGTVRFEWWHVMFVLFITSGNYAEAANKSSKFMLPKKFKYISQPNFASLTPLVKKYNATDLGMGFVDFLPPSFVLNALSNVIVSGDPSVNQYSEDDGNYKLRESIASLYSELINRDLDPNKNIIVTVGSTEALCTTIQAYTSRGDEWILIAPAFPLYRNQIELAGGVPRFVYLRQIKSGSKISSSDWEYDKKEMARAFNRKTKGILINNPHNPTGKMFTKEELQYIADLAIKWNTLVVTDEVYEWLAYDSNKHVRMATLPGMYERTITISSASKTFSVTGWRIGWAYGSSDLLSNLKVLHPVIVKCDANPMQTAIAEAMDIFRENRHRPNSYISNYVKELQSKRNHVVALLQKIGMTPIIPEGGYYVTANWTALAGRVSVHDKPGAAWDLQFTEWLMKNVGVFVLPVSGFYKPSENLSQPQQSYIRLCFTKKNETIDKLTNQLLEWFQLQ